MQAVLVEPNRARRAWALSLADRLGFALGHPIPLADPSFLGLLAQALFPEARPDPATCVSAADLLADELGREVLATEANLAGAALALQVAAAAAEAIACHSSHSALVELERVWSRTADLLGASAPHRPDLQRRWIAQALGDLHRPCPGDRRLAA